MRGFIFTALVLFVSAPAFRAKSRAAATNSNGRSTRRAALTAPDRAKLTRAANRPPAARHHLGLVAPGDANSDPPEARQRGTFAGFTSFKTHKAGLYTDSVFGRLGRRVQTAISQAQSFSGATDCDGIEDHEYELPPALRAAILAPKGFDLDRSCIGKSYEPPNLLLFDWISAGVAIEDRRTALPPVANPIHQRPALHARPRARTLMERLMHRIAELFLRLVILCGSLFAAFASKTLTVFASASIRTLDYIDALHGERPRQGHCQLCRKLAVGEAIDRRAGGYLRLPTPLDDTTIPEDHQRPTRSTAEHIVLIAPKGFQDRRCDDGPASISQARRAARSRPRRQGGPGSAISKAG